VKTERSIDDKRGFSPLLLLMTWLEKNVHFHRYNRASNKKKTSAWV